MSPMARSTKAIPSTAPTEPVGRPRELGDLRGHRGDAGEHEPTGADRGAEQERARGRQPRGRGRDRDPHADRDAGDRDDEAGGQQAAWRPSDPAARSSSVRPASSSARVCRPVVNIAMSAATIMHRGRDLEAATAPATVSSPTGGPRERDRRRAAADRGPVGRQRRRGVVERLAAERLGRRPARRPRRPTRGSRTRSRRSAKPDQRAGAGQGGVRELTAGSTSSAARRPRPARRRSGAGTAPPASAGG